MKDMKMKKPKMSKMGAEISRPGMAMPQFASRAMRPGGMAKGGKVHPDAAMDKKLIRKEIARAEKMEHKSEKKEMKKGGAVKKMAVGGMAPPAGRVQKMPAPAGGGVRTMPAPAGGPGGGRPGQQFMPRSGGSMSLGSAGGQGGGRPGQQFMPRPGGSMNLGTAGGPGGGRPGVMPSQQAITQQQIIPRSGVQTMPSPAGVGVRTMPAPAGGGVRTMPAPVGGGVQTMPAIMKKGGSVGKMARGGGVERKGKTKGKFI